MASTRSWPIEAAPTASESLRSAGKTLGLAAGTRGVELKPKRSAAATMRLRPSFAPSGAKTELHECVKELVSEPPQDSSLALRSRTPDSVADVRTG